MKKLFAITLLLTLFLQAIPVLHFFASPEKASVLYTVLDEDKPDEAKPKLKKDNQEFISYVSISVEQAAVISHHLINIASILPSPYLGLLTPPPDHLS